MNKGRIKKRVALMISAAAMIALIIPFAPLYSDRL